MSPAAFSNVLIVVVWTFFQNRILQHKNNSKNHTVTVITSFFFNFVFYFRFTISMKTTAKRTTWVSQFHISLWLAILESFWALWNFGRNDYKFRATWLWFRATWLRARWLSGDLTVKRKEDITDALQWLMEKTEFILLTCRNISFLWAETKNSLGGFIVSRDGR